MRLADQRAAIASGIEMVADSALGFRQLGTQRPGAMLRRILAGDQTGAGGGAGGIGTIGASEGGALGSESIKRGCLDFRVELTERIPVLLIGCDEKHVQF